MVSLKRPWFVDLSKMVDSKGDVRIGTFVNTSSDENNKERINVHFVPIGKVKERVIYGVPRNALMDPPPGMSPKDGMKILVAGEGGKAPFLRALGMAMSEDIDRLLERSQKAEIEAVAARDQAKTQSQGSRSLLKDIADVKKVIDKSPKLRKLPYGVRRPSEEDEEYD